MTHQSGAHEDGAQQQGELKPADMAPWTGALTSNRREVLRGFLGFGVLALAGDTKGAAQEPVTAVQDGSTGIATAQGQTSNFSAFTPIPAIAQEKKGSRSKG